MRWPRFHPENESGVVVEITARTPNGISLMVPGPNPKLFNETVVGVMGRALEISPIELCGSVFLTNHLHILAVVHEQQELSRFMQHLAGNLSKEIGRVRDWRGPKWERRYDGIVVSDEPEAQWTRLKYLLSNSVKEGLCESPYDWPGVHSAKATVTGEKLEGAWFNRTKEWAARQCGKEYRYYDFATRYQVGFAPLPAFRHLSEEEYQAKVADLVREIEEEGVKARDGDSVAGTRKILMQNPYKAPTKKTKRSPKPRFHYKSKEARDELRDDFRSFVNHYMIASEMLRSGKRLLAESSLFPAGCYPPALPFTGSPAPRRRPAPPTRQLVYKGKKVVTRGPIMVVEPPVRIWFEQPLARGHPL